MKTDLFCTKQMGIFYDVGISAILDEEEVERKIPTLIRDIRLGDEFAIVRGECDGRKLLVVVHRPSCREASMMWTCATDQEISAYIDRLVAEWDVLEIQTRFERLLQPTGIAFRLFVLGCNSTTYEGSRPVYRPNYHFSLPFWRRLDASSQLPFQALSR